MKFRINNISGVFFQKIKDGEEFNKWGVTIDLVYKGLRTKGINKVITKYFNTKEVAMLFCKSVNLYDYADRGLLNE